MRYGKLWNYNLQYANWLAQRDISVNVRLGLIQSLYDSLRGGLLELEPYPASLRIINVIKFLSNEKCINNDVIASLYSEMHFLFRNIEFHILGNHLLENAFALVMGGSFFGKEQWIEKGTSLVMTELKEQIHEDGAHFELSPMYHKIILFRVLEFIDWYSHASTFDDNVLYEVQRVAGLMISWLNKISFRNGKIPNFNDSAEGIAFPTNWLFDYALNDLGIKKMDVPLKDSGYRSVSKALYECKLDLAQISSSYQPGHGHSDALAFILFYKEKPLFVEQGTSTYQRGKRRDLERSTEAHNTVVVNNTSQSQVWGGFRVGNRAKVRILVDEENEFKAEHDGYRKEFGIIHNRHFLFKNDKIELFDFLSKPFNSMCYFHLFPGLFANQVDESRFLINNEVEAVFRGASKIELESYQYTDRFNNYQSAQRFVIHFSQELNSHFIFPN
ncbi:alginate lyase family protein [Sphingobacterium sp. JB170]|uniref:alginate lyase family protein n=1 Tax=Sphingobacterium sp. JB170 TaxID=1434842 RepID=UPI0015C69562|nr:alginate lyase family protein [Sphingobacterium sp. JB170]